MQQVFQFQCEVPACRAVIHALIQRLRDARRERHEVDQMIVEQTFCVGVGMRF